MNEKILDFTNLSLIHCETDDYVHVPEQKVVEIAEKHSVVSREPVQKLTRRKVTEPSANLNIRPSVTTFNRFVEFCEANRYTYPEALKELMDRAEV